MPTTFQLISSVNVATPTTTVSFTSIPATFTDLVLRVSGRTTSATVRTGGRLTFNSDSGANYDNAYIIQYDGTTLASSASFTGNNYFNLEYINGGNAVANSFGVTDFYISNYTDTTAKPMQMRSGAITNSATTPGQFLYGFTYNSTAAISSITMLINGANWAADSTFYLYGIKNS
jgi:hypothetical protein